MSSWLTFVIGIILGLLIGWLIDLLHRRRADRDSSPEPVRSEAIALPETAPEAIAAPGAETPVEEETGPAPENIEAEEPAWPILAARVAEVAIEAEPALPTEPHVSDEPPAEPEGLPLEAVEALAPAAAAAGAAGRAAGPVELRDKLIIIEGIGPVYEGKLQAAGISTFRQLAESSPERLREIIQPQAWQRVRFDEWLEQAQLIVEGKDEELKALQARLFSRKK